MSRIRIDLLGERVVWDGASTVWRGFTPRGQRLAAELSRLLPIERPGGEVPSLTLYLASELERLRDEESLDLEVELVEVDADESDLVDGEIG